MVNQASLWRPKWATGIVLTTLLTACMDNGADQALADYEAAKQAGI